MPKFANVVTIEVTPGHRDQVVTSLAAHKARVKDEPGTLQFEVLPPQGDDTKVFSFEMYRDAAAFEAHWCSSGFANTDLDLQLKKHGIHQLIVIGLIAHTCIEATVRFAAELGYQV